MKMTDVLWRLRDHTGKLFMSCIFKHLQHPMNMHKRIGDYHVMAGDTVSLVAYP